MFPEAFVEEQLVLHTDPGDLVYDPFSGRGTTVFQSLLMGREVAANDINPVAFCVSSAKAEIPTLDSVLNELRRLQEQFADHDGAELVGERKALPPFFRRAFYHSTLVEILFLRRNLRWRESLVHRFLAALALGSLHGEVNGARSYFSNQMPRTISTKPDYSLRYWKEKGLFPQKRDVFHILEAKARLRLGGEIPEKRGRVALEDVRRSALVFPEYHDRVRLFVTSPPYLDVTRYEEDQWLRLWFLGHPPHPTYQQISRDDRYENSERYWQFLAEAWAGLAALARDDAVVVCRLGAKGITEAEMTEGFLSSIRQTFPHAEMTVPPAVSDIRRRQTDAFRPGSRGCLFEVDYTVGLN
jgi:hypothetical protein